MKTNEQIACNNWEKIGIIKGRKQALEDVLKMIDNCNCDKFYRISVMELKAQIKKEMK